VSVIVPSYVYTYIKIGFLKGLVMSEEELEELSKFSEIKELINFIKPFFPELIINEYTIEEIEKSLYHTYIKLIGKIISVSPANMREFLRDFLLKYEIINIKNIILGSIIGLPTEEKRNNVNFLVEEYLERKELIEKLVSISSLDEIQLFMKNTMYNKAVREGIVYFRNNNEIFVLEAFLDKLYYENLLNAEINYNKYETIIIPRYIDILIEIYNLNIIYRGIINLIDKKLLKQFVVKNYLFLNEESINLLLEQANLDNFFKLLNDYLSQRKDLNKAFEPIEGAAQNPVRKIEEIYRAFYFEEFERRIDNIDFSTIYNILEILIKKEKEIKHHIIPNIVKIIHRNFNVFEDILS
jgi:vacuolar-type H+-ATPase subunit C/Vma6